MVEMKSKKPAGEANGNDTPGKHEGKNTPRNNRSMRKNKSRRKQRKSYLVDMRNVKYLL